MEDKVLVGVARVIAVFIDLDNTLVYVEEPNELTGDPIAWDYPRCIAKKIISREFNLPEDEGLKVFEKVREDLRNEGEAGWFEAFSVMTALGLEYRLADEIIRFEGVYLKAFPDSEPALRALRAKGLKLWIVSENGERHTRLKLIRSGLIHHITGVIGSDTYGGPKRTLLPYVNSLRDLKISQEDVAMVGDSYEMDVESAYRAGFRNLFLLDRKRPKEIDRVDAHTVINNLKVLARLLSR